MKKGQLRIANFIFNNFNIKFGSWSRISLHREKESLAVYSLIVKYLSIDTKTFTRLWIQVPIADKIHQKDFQSRKKIPI